MPRDLDALTGTPYDLLVVGGGIHGLFIAYDAALRGLRVALVERADFGSGLSFNHQRTLHGGLRSLERGRLRHARRMIAERRNWALMAPHLLRPLPFLIGTYRFTRRSKWLLKAGFRVYDTLGRKRNRGVSPELHLPNAKLESASATRSLFRGVAAKGLSGGAVWYDYQTVHPDRLTWAVAQAARHAGATLVNHVEAIGPLRDGARIAGARVRDLLTGREVDVAARVTVLAAGGGLGPAMELFGATGAPPTLRAMNLLLNRPGRDIATAAPGPSGRMLTAVPWAGYVLVGTHQSATMVEADATAPPEEAIETFLAEANATFPTLEAKRTDVRLIHAGLAPATLKNGRAELVAESRVLSGPAGLVSVVGTKFTTARLTAAAVLDAVRRDVPAAAGRCRTAATPLPHAGITDVEGRLIEATRALEISLDRDVMIHLAGWYGGEAPDVVRFAAAAGQLDRLADDTPVLTGEIAYAVAHADAARLGDAVMRRTPLGSAGRPSDAALDRAAAVMAAALDWTADQTAAERAAVDKAYR